MSDWRKPKEPLDAWKKKSAKQQSWRQQSKEKALTQQDIEDLKVNLEIRDRRLAEQQNIEKQQNKAIAEYKIEQMHQRYLKAAEIVDLKCINEWTEADDRLVQRVMMSLDTNTFNKFHKKRLDYLFRDSDDDNEQQ